MQILSNPISALNVRESLKFPRTKGNLGQGTRRRRQILDRLRPCRACAMKNTQYNAHLRPNR